MNCAKTNFPIWYTAIMVGFFLNLIGVQVDQKLFPYPIINQIFADAVYLD